MWTSKVFVSGRISAEEDRASKLILEKHRALLIFRKRSFGFSFPIWKSTVEESRSCTGRLMDSEGEDEVDHLRQEREEKENSSGQPECPCERSAAGKTVARILERKT